MSRQQFVCTKCGSHDLNAKPVTITDNREDPATRITGEWVLVCKNGHPHVGAPGDVIQVTGESS